MDAVLDTGVLTVEDLLNFNFDDDGEENDENTEKAPPSSTPCTDDALNHRGPAFPELAEEELEWLSNKDAFPPVDTCLDILSENPDVALNHHSPVSVLENIIINSISNKNNNSLIKSFCGGHFSVPVQYPVKARSKRRQRRQWACFLDLPTQHFALAGQEKATREMQSPVGTPPKIGRRCSHCQMEKTPQWRAGPMGPKTLCNACGVRYKSGRLVPEYRPASSPTFSSLLHSNSHRKVVEIRRQKQSEGMVVKEPCAYRVG